MNDQQILDEVAECVIKGDEFVFQENTPWYKCIIKACKLIRPILVVEFGVRAGYSAKVVDIVCNHQVTIIGYDADVDVVSKGYYHHAHNILPDMEIHNFNTNDLIAIPRCSLLLVDGDHSYNGCKHDLELGKQYANHILIDDYNSVTVKTAVDEFIKENGFRYLIFANERAAFIEIKK